MALSYEFLVARADQAAEEAAVAVLDNVRDRALRSETAWRKMANQLLETVKTREIAAETRATAQARA